MGKCKVKKRHSHTSARVSNSEQSSGWVCIWSCDMFFALKFFKFKNKNLYVIIRNEYITGSTSQEAAINNRGEMKRKKKFFEVLELETEAAAAQFRLCRHKQR